MMRRAKVAVVLVAAMSVAGCGDSEGTDGTMNSPTAEPLPASAAEGAKLCDFVPEEAVRMALGRDEITGDGYLNRRGDGSVTTGNCHIYAEGAADPALDVTILGAHAPEGAAVVEEAASAEADFVFPEDIAIGVGYRKDDFLGENGVEGRGGAVTKALWGDSVIQIAINDKAENRDAMADAVALTQQIAGVLELPASPSSPYPTP